MVVGKKTPSAIVAIFEGSPMPSHRMSSGKSAIFGIGNRADTIEMPIERASPHSPMARPTARPAVVPSAQPMPIRMAEAAICWTSSPLAASAMSACTMANGLGRNSGLIQPKLPAACHSAMMSTKAARLPYQRGLRTKPPPRNRTGASRAVSDMRDLAFGIDRLSADQRPEVLVQAGKLDGRVRAHPLAARDQHMHDLTQPPRTAREHRDAIGKPQGLVEIMRDVDRAEAR